MYTAIIADDEKKICQLILKLGHWTEIDIEVVDICSDGEEVLNSIYKNKPDIVLTDIRMPVYDGLEIIKQVAEKKLEMAFIIISGYKQFEYAQTAIHYGVVDFLVKPIGEEALNRALLNATSKVGHAREKNLQSEQIEFLKEERNKTLKEELLRNILVENEPFDKQLEAEYECDFINGIFQAMCIRTNREELNAEKSVFAEKVADIVLREVLICHEIIVASKNEDFFVMFNYEEKAKEKMRKIYYKLYKAIALLEDNFGAFSFSISIGIPVDNIGVMWKSVNTAKTAWKAHIVCSKKDILEYEHLKFDEATEDDFIKESEFKEFESMVETYQGEQIGNFINHLEAKVQKKGMIAPDVLFGLAERLTYHYTFALSFKDATKRNEYFERLSQTLMGAQNVSTFFMTLKRDFLLTLKEHYEDKVEEACIPIREAKKYIEENYSSPITLEEIATYVGLSPVYFSKLFKKTEGNNYIDYLTNVRINVAKEKLRKTKESIDQIALHTGYADERYFRKLFKKHTGIKPAEYRKLHQ
ncbi:response regulator [Lachnospiraceae bacterium ZAX-1]